MNKTGILYSLVLPLALAAASAQAGTVKFVYRAPVIAENPLPPANNIAAMNLVTIVTAHEVELSIDDLTLAQLTSVETSNDGTSSDTVSAPIITTLNMRHRHHGSSSNVLEVWPVHSAKVLNQFKHIFPIIFRKK